MRNRLKKQHLIPAIYLLSVVICILFLFIFDSPYWLLALFGLTLPLSILTFFFILGAIHLGDNSGIIILILIPAIINAFLIYLIAGREKNFSGEA